MWIQASGNSILVCGILSLIFGACILSGCIEIGDTATTPAMPVQSYLTSNPPAETQAPVSPAYVPPATSPSEKATLAPGSAEYTSPKPPNGAFQPDHRPLSYAPENTIIPLDYPTAPFFQGAYSLGYSNIGIIANVSNPPFVIEFKTDARNRNPNDALVIITVRDPGSGRIVEEEGYNGQYSSDNIKRIIIRDQGSYHVNIYGYGSTVQVTLRGGVPPDKAVPYGVFAPPPAQVAASPGEENYEDVAP